MKNTGQRLLELRGGTGLLVVRCHSFYGLQTVLGMLTRFLVRPLSLCKAAKVTAFTAVSTCVSSLLQSFRISADTMCWPQLPPLTAVTLGGTSQCHCPSSLWLYPCSFVPVGIQQAAHGLLPCWPHRFWRLSARASQCGLARW